MSIEDLRLLLNKFEYTENFTFKRSEIEGLIKESEACNQQRWKVVSAAELAAINLEKIVARNEQLQTEIERLKVESERELRRELAVRVHRLKDEVKDLTGDRDQLKGRYDAMESLMKIMRTHEDMPSGYKYPVSLWFPAIDALLSKTKPAGSDKV